MSRRQLPLRIGRAPQEVKPVLWGKNHSTKPSTFILPKNADSLFVKRIVCSRSATRKEWFPGGQKMASNQTDLNAPVFNELAVMQNLASVDYCRIFTALLSGSTAGILGLTGLYGFVFFFVANGLVGVFVLHKYNAQYRQYFKQFYAVFSHGLFGSLLTYILFWTFLYGLVHVY